MRVISPLTKDDSMKAIFVEYDRDFPDEDCILAIKIGSYAHLFRWPLRYTKAFKLDPDD